MQACGYALGTAGLPECGCRPSPTAAARRSLVRDRERRDEHALAQVPARAERRT